MNKFPASKIRKEMAHGNAHPFGGTGHPGSRDDRGDLKVNPSAFTVSTRHLRINSARYALLEPPDNAVVFRQILK